MTTKSYASRHGRAIQGGGGHRDGCDRAPWSTHAGRKGEGCPGEQMIGCIKAISPCVKSASAKLFLDLHTVLAPSGGGAHAGYICTGRTRCILPPHVCFDESWS